MDVRVISRQREAGGCARVHLLLAALAQKKKKAALLRSLLIGCMHCVARYPLRCCIYCWPCWPYFAPAAGDLGPVWFLAQICVRELGNYDS